MRRFISTLQIIFMVVAVAMLAGCSYMTSISNKNPPMQTTAKGLKQAEPTAVCKNWCHNGWCSTHCQNSSNAK